MNTESALMTISALIIFMLGFLHLVYTFSGPKLRPRDPDLIASMKKVHMGITTETTMWKAWIGFNASHSLAAILFALLFGYLGLVEPDVLFGSLYLQVVGFLMLVSLAILGRLYWFSVPFIGIVVATLCYAAGIVSANS